MPFEAGCMPFEIGLGTRGANEMYVIFDLWQCQAMQITSQPDGGLN
jgi:hypothetical protein